LFVDGRRFKGSLGLWGLIVKKKQKRALMMEKLLK